MITLYDIPSTIQDKAWSPNTWKARYTLNYKQLDYTTEWIEYPDIKSTCLSLGAKPAGGMRNGERIYSLPVIHDSKTGKVISDSQRIAEYLDETYPDTPKIILPGTRGLIEAFGKASDSHGPQNWGKWVLYQTFSILNEASKPFFRSTREAGFSNTRATRDANRNIKIEDKAPKPGVEHATELQKFVDGFKWYADVLDKEEGPFVMGETMSFADLYLATDLLWCKLVWGEKSEEWKKVEESYGGRLGKLLKDLEKYQIVP